MRNSNKYSVTGQAVKEDGESKKLAGKEYLHCIDSLKNGKARLFLVSCGWKCRTAGQRTQSFAPVLNGNP